MGYKWLGLGGGVRVRLNHHTHKHITLCLLMILSLFAYFTHISACGWTSSARTLTLISDVLKLGTVVVLVHDENVKLTNANQRVSCLVSGGYRHGVLPLALTIKFPCGHNCSYKRRHNKAEQTAYLHLTVPQIIWNPTRKGFPQFALELNLKTEQMRSKGGRERRGIQGG